MKFDIWAASKHSKSIAPDSIAPEDFFQFLLEDSQIKAIKN